MADVDNLSLHVSLIQFVCHDAQGRIGAAMSVWASVNQ